MPEISDPVNTTVELGTTTSLQCAVRSSQEPSVQVCHDTEACIGFIFSPGEHFRNLLIIFTVKTSFDALRESLKQLFICDMHVYE